MSGPAVAVFAPDALGHFGPLRAVIAGLAEQGATVHVLTSRAFAADVEAAGGRFVDMFGPYPLAAADDESLPVVSRYVTYAGHYADAITRDVSALGVSLVVADTFAVIGRAVANALAVPYVSVVAGHNLAPGPYIEHVKATRQVVTSDRCSRAVDVLRERYGIANASPFSYADGLSPHLNLLCEPPEWLTAGERRAFEPAAFVGSLAPARMLEAPRPPAGFRGGSPKVYVALGTVPWWYWPELVTDTLETVARAVGATADLVISVGGLDVPQDRVAAMRSAGAKVVEHLHTWAALGEADVFVTSQGANSTHEAAYSRVPMLSYPFHGDQTELAERCESFGIGLRLVDEPRAPLTADAVADGIAAIGERRGAFDEALERARGWELAVVAGREAVIDRVLSFAQA
jgi:UDP:flavonoid glycosyltransferase YjiC (YdhE family)